MLVGAVLRTDRADQFSNEDGIGEMKTWLGRLSLTVRAKCFNLDHGPFGTTAPT